MSSTRVRTLLLCSVAYSLALSACYVEVASSYHPKGSLEIERSADTSDGEDDGTASIEVWTGFFWDVGGVAVQGSPVGYGSMDYISTKEDFGISNTGPHLRLDVDLPVALPDGLNLRATAAYVAFDQARGKGLGTFQTENSGSDLFAGITLSSFLHDLSLSAGVHHLSFTGRGDSALIFQDSWGVQARVMVRLGLATYYFARHGQLPAHSGRCRYTYLGYRC